MSALNKQFFQKNSSTDVISFTYDNEHIPEEEDDPSGEVVVNIDAAIRQVGHKPASAVLQELLFYMAHGIDHLCGYNDDTPEQRNIMHTREQRWLSMLPPTIYQEILSA